MHDKLLNFSRNQSVIKKNDGVMTKKRFFLLLKLLQILRQSFPLLHLFSDSSLLTIKNDFFICLAQQPK